MRAAIEKQMRDCEWRSDNWGPQLAFHPRSDQGTGKERESERGEAAGLTQQKILFEARTHAQPCALLTVLLVYSEVTFLDILHASHLFWKLLFSCVISSPCVCWEWGMLNAAPWREPFTAELLRAVTHAFNLTNKSLMVFCESMEMQCQFWCLISISVTSPYV